MRHSPCTLSTHVMSSAEHEVALWEGRIVVYGRRGAGAVQSSLHGLNCVTQSGERKLGLESSLACYRYSSHCSFNLVIYGLPLAQGVAQGVLSAQSSSGRQPDRCRVLSSQETGRHRLVLKRGVCAPSRMYLRHGTLNQPTGQEPDSQMLGGLHSDTFA